MDEMAAIWMGVLIVGLSIAFPVYVLVRLAQLGRAVSAIRGELARLRARREALRAEPELLAPFAPETAAPAQPSAGWRTAAPPPAAEPVRAAAEAARAAEQPPPPLPPPPREAPRPAFEVARLETLLGANWLSKLGIAALALATAFFLKHAFESRWIGETARVAIGVVAAAIMLGLGQVLLSRARYRAYAQVLSSGGIVILFLSIYAAYNFYHLIGFWAAFAVLALAALSASALAVANNTQAVAVICLLGAFATPVLIRSGGEGAGDLLRLYAYLAGLNLWSAILVRYRAWHALTVVSFGATWVLFLGAGPLQRQGYLATEAFAALFLAFACYGGMATARPRAAAAEPGAAREVEPEAERLGVFLVLGGCAFFAIASALILSGVISLGLPALAMVGVLLGLLMAVLSLAFPGERPQERIARSAFRYLAGAALVLLMAISIGTAPPVPLHSAAAAFLFGLFTYLVFLAVAVKMSGTGEQEGPAAALFAANGVTHAMVAFHALGEVRIWGINAAPLWLPLAGCIGVCALWAARRDGLGRLFVPAAALTVQAMSLVALFGAFAIAGRWPAGRGAALFGADFLLCSVAWIALRRVVRRPDFRGDLVGAFGNAAIFFGLLATAVRLESYEGLVLLSGCAIAMAAYHAVVGGSVLRQPDDDALHRFVYLGLALTFVTIAIPLQLRASYITLAWAVESAALVWTGLSAGHPRVRQAGLALLAVTAAKALFVDIAQRPDPFILLLNERMLAGASVIAAASVSAWLLREAQETLSEWERPAAAVLTLGANFFALVFVSLDLWDYMGVAWVGAERESAQQLSLSLFWSVYALAGMSVGIWKRMRPVRLFAIGLLYVAITKVFVFDLGFLEVPFRIVSFFVLGLILMLVSLLYTRFEGRLK